MIKDGKAPNKIKNKYGVIFKKWWVNYKIDKYIQEDTRCNFLNFMNCLNDEFEIIEDSKVWKPKEDEEYYYLENNGFPNKEFKNKEVFGGRSEILLNERYEIGNCYKTFEEAEKVLEKIKIYTRLKRYALEHNTEKIDWNNQMQYKYYLDYDYFNKKIKIFSSILYKDIGQVCFTSRGICERAIKEIGEDNIKKLFEE